ncbi:hypothetical protein CK203_114970 [Vitis vinifera]|uniref:Uncharacterized protein n=1 Tax=Vitis vinifera TaxID=29760 RepID=A0A438E0E8_VITVI|nr:hypothetical protein CK203_114970 [Vitis vinifera]
MCESVEAGRTFLLLELEDEEEAERVLKRGTRRFKDKVLYLERWSEETGCLQVGSQAKEVWVRVVGLPLHYWSGEMFKRIGDCCGGYVEWSILVVMQSSCGGRGCHGFLSSDGMGKERWCAAEADGAGLVKKNGGNEKGDGDRTTVSANESSTLGKEDGEKGSGGVGLSEKEGYARPVCCKPVYKVVQAQRISGLECEGPAIISSSRLGWALKERETCGPKVCREEGQPSKGVERASCDGPTNIQWDGRVSGRRDSSEAEKGATGRCSLADACLLEVEGALIEVEKSRGMDAFLKENEGELTVSPLRVCTAEERLDEKVVGESFLLKERRDERVEKSGRG